MFEQFAAGARAAVASAVDEAALRGDRRIGTEHLLLGVLHEPGAVRALGAGLDSARAVRRAEDRHQGQGRRPRP
ncbi:Clp protease N-terminal domain-containing protein, partial [Streptomyces seoulensis]